MALKKKPAPTKGPPGKPAPTREHDAREARDRDARDREDEFHAGVGQALRAARKIRTWTQVELAERAGLSSNYIACLERGEVGLSLWVAHRLAHALGTSLDALLANEKEAPPLARTKFAKTRFAL